MGRATSKADLISSASANYEQLKTLISSLSEKELLILFTFDEKKKEDHWKRDKNPRDVLIHLYEWHQLLLDWVSSNQRGEKKPFIPEPYNWRTYGEMNLYFWEKHQNTALEEAKEMLEKSHQAVMNLAESFTNEELFSKGVFQWTGSNALGSYFVSATASHYDWAIKKLKAHRRNCKSL